MDILSVRLALAILVLLAISLLLQRWVIGASRQRLHAVQFASLATLVILALSALIPRGLILAYSFRPHPASAHEIWFQGVEYFRETRTAPRPAVIHVVKINLDAPGIGSLVTPPDPLEGRQLRGETTSQFLARYKLQIAINGDFFEPWSDNTPLEFYPHLGDPVDVLGFAASRGRVYSQGQVNHPTLYLSQDNQASFDQPIGPIWNAISGNLIFVKTGIPDQIELSDSYHQMPHPRTAVALDSTGRTLILILVDGRQSSYSEGATMRELAEIAIHYGAFEALNLDGGGSTALVIAGPDGQPILINSPIHTHMPTAERPIANHLGIYAQPVLRP